MPPPPHHEETSHQSQHSVVVGGETIEYTATAGRIVLTEEEGKKQASFFYVAYTRDGVTDLAKRPVTFAFNGGPGSSSVWLHLGAYGPRRVEMTEDGMAMAPPGRLVDNEHSILDETDLVFIDPVSTGFSRAIPEEDAKKFHHFKRDIESVGQFIQMYLSRNGRWQSPKFLAGESYGTTRSAGLAGHLLDRYGLYLNGLLLVSSVLNFQTVGMDRNTWTFNRGNDLPYIMFLPTYAATAWYHGLLSDELQAMSIEDFSAEVREFALGRYASALLHGSSLDSDEYDEVAAEVSRYTGLAEDYVREYDLRIEILRFCKELMRQDRRTVGRIDSRYLGTSRFVRGESMETDPSIDAVLGPYTTALNDYVRRELGYESDLPYEVLTDRVRPWSYEDFQNAYVDVSETLRSTMARNPYMRTLVANGYFDLATPFTATEFTFSHLGVESELAENIEMTYYEAGHMMYVHLPSLEKLAEDSRDFIRRALA
ncbi:MAG: peptidase S10 [Acidimicrobiia bacterium]|nr:peptidase S10 [Acidimicrobiia bacterium]